MAETAKPRASGRRKAKRTVTMGASLGEALGNRQAVLPYCWVPRRFRLSRSRSNKIKGDGRKPRGPSLDGELGTASGRGRQAKGRPVSVASQSP